jgi:hypothetical protein
MAELVVLAHRDNRRLRADGGDKRGAVGAARAVVGDLGD